MAEPTSERTRNFQCSLCPSRFYHANNVTEHIRRHLKEKAFTCNQCTYMACASSDLRHHAKVVHEKLTPFNCSFAGCSYSTARSGNLQKHRRTHDADPLTRRPFPCDFPGCDYRATHKAQLTKHTESQHNENRAKTFACSLCSATFHEKKNLRPHITEVHVKETIYSCSKCHYNSSRKRNVNKHMHTVHDDDDDGRAHEPRHGTPTPASSGQEVSIEGSDNGSSSYGLQKVTSADDTELAEYDVGDDQNYIYQCRICQYVAHNKEEAWKHSKVHKAPSASSN